MSYPYPQLLQLLQHQATALEYQQIIQKYLTSTGSLRGFNRGDDYWQIVPSYLFACCPFCQTRWQQQIDTYSLLGWGGTYSEIGCAVYDLEGGRERGENHVTKHDCQHGLTTHLFLNLHGQSPVEVQYLANNTGEVPRITNWALSDNIESYAVMHALPLCRVEKGQFVPSYTLFILTYFSMAPQTIIHQHYQDESERGKGDKEYYPASLDHPDKRAVAEPYYDLQTWSTKGRLGYLDFTVPDLPLRIGPGTELPAIYQKVPGARYTFTWRKGMFETIVNGYKVARSTIP
jgi:hypothetical protein